MIYTIDIQMLQQRILVYYGDGKDHSNLLETVRIDFSTPTGFRDAMREAADSITADLLRAGAL